MHACFWDKNKASDLGILAVGHVSRAYAINNLGEAVGDADDANGVQHAVMWRGGRLLDLGYPRDCGWAIATSINNRGEVLGKTSGNRIFIFNKQSGMRLVHLEAVDTGFAILVPIGINDSGVIPHKFARNYESEVHRRWVWSS